MYVLYEPLEYIFETTYDFIAYHKNSFIQQT